ncbi:hypothetical protein SAMN05660652_00619 [Propionivibrio dicarboxylicus]|uniref:Uncharacterized protein n=1 Tax=Propionivibrio dicarboxylicus TaxID=83767 RepID=A0A1G7WSC5_9RHOO|nr:hypothetical protein SAMN05660652_00619 [Propionivibrio dicarboxylicus]
MCAGYARTRRARRYLHPVPAATLRTHRTGASTCNERLPVLATSFLHRRRVLRLICAGGRPHVQTPLGDPLTEDPTLLTLDLFDNQGSSASVPTVTAPATLSQTAGAMFMANSYSRQREMCASSTSRCMRRSGRSRDMLWRSLVSDFTPPAIPSVLSQPLPGSHAQHCFSQPPATPVLRSARRHDVIGIDSPIRAGAPLQAASRKFFLHYATGRMRDKRTLPVVTFQYRVQVVVIAGLGKAGHAV